VCFCCRSEILIYDCFVCVSPNATQRVFTQTDQFLNIRMIIQIFPSSIAYTPPYSPEQASSPTRSVRTKSPTRSYRTHARKRILHNFQYRGGSRPGLDFHLVKELDHQSAEPLEGPWNSCGGMQFDQDTLVGAQIQFEIYRFVQRARLSSNAKSSWWQISGR